MTLHLFGPALAGNLPLKAYGPNSAGYFGTGQGCNGRFVDEQQYGHDPFVTEFSNSHA